MRTSRNVSKKKTFTKYMQEKLAVTFLVITLALFGLVVSLYNVVEAKNKEYTEIVLNQHSAYDSRTIPYRRGDIVDRNGTYLATSEKVYNLILDPNQINKGAEDYLDPTVNALCEVFGYERSEVLKALSDDPDSYYVRYERRLSAEQKEAFETKAEETNKAFIEAKSKKRVKGVWFEDEYRRIYPYNSLACNVVGFSYDNGAQGMGGIEQHYNSELVGTNGREYGYLDDESNMEKVIKPAENGNVIVSTIDVNIQKIVEKYIDEWMSELGSQTAAVLVMDPNNGEILAMSSNRRFDLNNPRDLSAYYTEAEIARMTEKEKNDAWNQMWRNYCVNDSFEPGSPAKILTVAACLEEGVVTRDSTFFCDGVHEVGGYEIHCSNRSGHNLLDLEQVVMKSCNDAMMQMSAQLGIKRFTKYQKIFGIGQKSGIDLPGEADTSGLIYTSDTMGPTELATSSFGQGYNGTMVQMAAAISSVINGGSYYEPHVVKQILNDQGNVVRKVGPELVRKTVSQSTSEFLCHALFMTVEEGTGKVAQVEGFKVGGKTGTAEKIPRSAKNYLLSFAGFAPADDPRILIYVIVDTPNLPPGPEQAHSSFATGIFQKILVEALPYLNVFPDTPVPEEEDDLSGRTEGITNNNEGGLEPAPERGAESGGEETESGEALESTAGEGETEPGQGGQESTEESTASESEEVIPFEGGLGLPDNVPGGLAVETLPAETAAP